MQERITYLIKRKVTGHISNSELHELNGLLTESNREAMATVIAKLLSSGSEILSEDRAGWEQRIRQVVKVDLSTSTAKQIHRVHFLRKWGWAAASIILVLGIGTYLWTTNKKNTQPAIVAAETGDIAPGKNGAILTLANGKQVVLDSLGNGVIASQNGTQVRLTDDGLAYDPSGAASGEVVYNTMSTPKGRQFQVTLPDGTQVWLNSASSIRYPTIFNGKERQVIVTGEAYFEVAKNAKQPFKVNINNKAAVEVLGTHFNVNAYDNEESIHTTLLEGSVRVVKEGKNAILKPGQQAQLPEGQHTQPGTAPTAASSEIKVINDADIEKVMAWKNGLFNFKDATLEEVMRQLERWYDIEVVYEKGVPDVELMGEMTKDVPLNGLLKNLGELELHYKLEGRKLIVLPASEK